VSIRNATGTDDEVEIEVIHHAAPAPAGRGRRKPNSAADEVIATGEIVEHAARSLVVRAGSKIEISDELSIPARVAPAEKSSRKRTMGLLVVALLVPAVAATAMLANRTATRTDEPVRAVGTPAAVEASAELIGVTLDAEARAALVQAQAIASSSMLRAAIQTDAKTLADMVRDHDLVVSVERDEIVEVFQVRDGARASLLRIPAGGPSLQAPPPGKMRIIRHGNGVAAIATASITNQAGVEGEVVISIPIDLEPVRARLRPHVIGATLTGLPSPVSLVTAAGTGTAVELPIATKLVDPAPLKLTAVF
jgi:hypothetical protein